MVTSIRPSQLQAWFGTQGADTSALVLDVREPHELQRASVAHSASAQGFTLVAIPMHSVPQQLAALDPEQPIACLCHHGARSMQVAQFLESRGYSCVANITGGIHAWSQELDPSIAMY